MSAASRSNGGAVLPGVDRDKGTRLNVPPPGSSPGPVARLLLGAVRFYRTAISPLRPPSCRYTPSCSAYAVQAIQIHGAGRGSWLALRRLLRCHPFHAGGHDPVPPRVAIGESVPLMSPSNPAA